MKQREFTFREVSGPPWHISCTVEQVGSDYVCRIHGGDWHVGAVALSQRFSGRTTARSLVVGGHKEEEMAIHTAHRLCRASRGSVVVIAGIHFESLSRRGIEEITRSVSHLTARAARTIRDRRLRDSLQVPGGVHTRTQSELGDAVLTAETSQGPSDGDHP